jgi:tetratricopeptide (TPR) repeat protein
LGAVPVADQLDRLKAALSDRYRIERELGSGGMATVYLAQDLKHERQVAVKVLRPELAAALGPERFHQEIKIAANLTHPHILPLHDSGDAEGFLYYVMPHIEGESLRDKLAREGELPIAEAVRILRDVVDALCEAHEKGVVHRDIKPDNVLLTKHHALVTDFGVAKAVSEATGAHRLTTDGVALGTPAYMSPEQAAADKHTDHRADIYAVGALAYELLTGRPPFTGTTPQEVLSAQVTKPPTAVTEYRATVPPTLAQVVMKCLEKKAADRWQTAEELLPQLDALATPSGGVTPTGMMPVDRALKRRWMMAGGAIGVAAVISLIVAVAAFPRRSGISLDPERIVVAVFRNETGDASLDQLGSRAGHWITQGLQQAAIQVTPWDGALEAWQYVRSERAVRRVRDPIRALAEETGAGTVVSGVVYLENDSIEIHVNVTDAVQEKPLGAIDPVRGPRESAREVIADIQQRVMGFLAINFDDRIAAQASGVARPPSFEAYSSFDNGMVHYLRREYGASVPYFYRALELDTSFVTPLIYAALSHMNLGEWEQVDSLAGILGRFREQLSDYDRHWLEYVRARMEGDHPEALHVMRQAAELAPGSKAVYNQAYSAVFNNRPREAIEALLTLDPERGPMRGWRSYFHVLVEAYALLAEHENALNAARRYRAIYGDDAETLGRAGLALAAVGHVEEVNAVLDDLIALPEQGVHQGLWITEIGVYLRRNGYEEAAQSTFERATRWFETRLPEVRSTEAWRWNYLWTLYSSGRCDDAYSVATSLSDEFADNFTYRGAVGVFAACRGDREEALEISRWLEDLTGPYLHGYHTVFRFMIAGALGDGENTVALWRQAFAEGFGHPPPWRWGWTAIEPVRNYEPLREFLRPKG